MILITGAAGFIGSAIAWEMSRRGRAGLVLCDGLGSGEKWKNLRELRFRRFVHRDDLFTYLDRDPEAGRIEAVVHLGACSCTTQSDMDFLLRSNVDFSIRLCTWCLERGARFVYASSAAVYGDGSRGFSDADELTPHLQPLNKYGFSKWMFDMWVLEHGFADRVAGMRYFNVFGPNEYHKGEMASVIFRAFPQAAQEGMVRLFESHRDGIAHGEQARDFVSVDEAVAITMFLLETPAANGIFNAGTGRAHTFNELAAGLFEGLGRSPRIEYFPMPPELRDRYQYFTCADMSRLQAAGFVPGPDRFQEHVAGYVRDYLLPGCLHLGQVQPE